jgi:hypothetical protein
VKERFERYLQAIGLTQTLIGRVEQIIQFYEQLAPGEIRDILVTDYIGSDEQREYESLWLFSDLYAMEAKGFVSRDEFDMVCLCDRVTRWQIQKENYDFASAAYNSRLNIHADTDARWYYQFKASRENCDNLRDLFLKYILPNFKQREASAPMTGSAAPSPQRTGT